MRLRSNSEDSNFSSNGVAPPPVKDDLIHNLEKGLKAQAIYTYIDGATDSVVKYTAKIVNCLKEKVTISCIIVQQVYSWQRLDMSVHNITRLYFCDPIQLRNKRSMNYII